MSHRATSGYCVEGEVLRDVENLSQIQSIHPYTAMGGCLMRTPLIQSKTFLDGVIYHPSGFDLDSRIARMIGAEDLSGLASELANVDGSYAFIYPSDGGLCPHPFQR